MVQEPERSETACGDGPTGVRMPDWLAQRRAETQLAMIHPDGRWTYQELYDRSAQVAFMLKERGVQPGERVAIIARHGLVFAATLHAVRFLQAVLVPINTRLSPAEIAWQVDDACADYVVLDCAHEPLWAQAQQQSQRQLQTLTLDGAHFTEVSGHVAPEWVALERVQSLMYTSGTTGKPKGAMITYGNHFFGATASAYGLGVDKQDVWYTAMPLFHVGGQAVLMRSLFYGTTALIHDRFDVEAALRACDDEQVTLLSVVSVMLADLLRARSPKPWPKSIRCILLGGGPAPEALLRRAADAGLAVSQSYGLTESNSQAVTLLPHDALRKLGSAGKPLLCTEVQIKDEGAQLPAFATGEIALRGPTLVAGYWQRPAATAASFRDGWLYTGDLGYLDDEGYLYVLDRRSDLIVSGGENVYPAEVEAALLTHPDVLEAGVTAVADERYGQRPAAVVVLRGEARVSEAQLQAFCRERLAGYKVPQTIAFTHELPRSAAGKLLRRELGAWL